MGSSDWSSDVCSSDLVVAHQIVPTISVRFGFHQPIRHSCLYLEVGWLNRRLTSRSARVQHACDTQGNTGRKRALFAAACFPVRGVYRRSPMQSILNKDGLAVALGAKALTVAAYAEARLEERSVGKEGVS